VQEALRKQAGDPVQDKNVTVKVSTSKLDNVVDMVGELVIAESLVFQNPLVQASNDQKLFKDFSQLHRITSELQKTAMSMRMVAIKQTFQKMVRLVRDLARKAGKEVDLHMSGEETEIDRRMVDEISDPMIHMIRNAVDHGLEAPEEREAAGKDLKGNIYLRAYHQGGHLLIEIRDDGRGLNREKIYRNALKKGIIRPNESLNEKEIYNLIFLPGFSTADQVTDISGRGVGMDVVKKFIDKVRGSVEIDSTPGEGTLFTIKLPLTLAIIDGILVQVGKERYILPTVTVKESFQPKEDQFYTVAKKGEVVSIRGKVFPLIRLYHILNVPAEKTKPHQGIIVVVEYENEEVCLLIDELVGKQEVVIKSLGSQFIETKGFSGGAILGDGRVGLILDIKGILELYRENTEHSPVNLDAMAVTSHADASELYGDIG
jgi:two-component system chemotaxis sensor kinase CheA